MFFIIQSKCLKITTIYSVHAKNKHNRLRQISINIGIDQADILWMYINTYICKKILQNCNVFLRTDCCNQEQILI